MENQDWKAMLGAAFNISPGSEKSDDDKDNNPEARAHASAVEQQGKQVVNIVLDKKGRNGKKATIIENLNIDDESLKELAAQLKRACGVGGSARGGEILIQGDMRQKVLETLTKQGFKARII